MNKSLHPKSEVSQSDSLDYPLVASPSIASRLRILYKTIKRPLAFLLVIVAAFPQIIPIPSVQISAISVLAVMIIEVLFDIHANITKKDPPRVFTEFFEASGAIKQAIINALERRQKVHIRAFGMSMAHAWPFLVNTLTPVLENERKQCIEIEIAMIDSQWPELANINPDWASRAETNYNEILRFSKAHAKSLEEKEWKISVYKYRYMPNWHGILINSESLFLSVCFWKNGKLTGAENQYEFHSSSDSDLGLHRISQFITWFEFVRVTNQNSSKTDLLTN